MPPLLRDLAETLRDRFDFEVIDEALIAAGALSSLSVLGMLECDELSARTQEAIAAFVARGGRLVVGPDVASSHRASGALAPLLANAPSADEGVELGGEAPASMLIRLGMHGDPLRLAGEWHPREDASQFRGLPPAGEGARWTGHRASAFFPVKRGTRYLLEIECWVHPRAADLEHAVFADVARLGAIRRAGLQRFAAWIPAEVARRDVLEIAIESATFKPSDHGVGPDGRELGVAVMWLRLTQEGAPAANLADGQTPQLTGRVDEAALHDRGTLYHEDGTVIVSRRRPLVTLVELLDHAARTRSEYGRHSPREAGSGEPLPGLRLARFDDRVVLWNRTGDEKIVTLGDDTARPPIVVPPNGLVGLDLRSGRYLGGAGS
jgi:hypothetical protein